ncbi:MAG: glycosyltransferase family 39 protein [Candidatus Aenigmatarchaeota archaeon]
MKEIEISVDIKKIHLVSLVLILVVVLVAELQVTFNTPINFGDEGYHTTIIQWLADKKEFPVWVPRISNELVKPGYWSGILYHLIIAGLMVSGFQEAIVRFIVPFVGVFCGLTVFILIKRIYNENVGWFASILLVTFPSFVTYSVLFYRDALFNFFLSLFFLIFILSVKENSKKYFFLSAIFTAFSILLKTAGFVVYFFIGFAFFYEIFTERKFSPIFKKYFIWFLISSAILLPFYLRNIYYYKGLCYLPYTPSFFEKIPLLSSKGCNIDNYQDKYEFSGRVEQTGTEANVFSIGLTSYLDFAYGNLFITVVGFFCGLLLLIFERKKIDVFVLFVLLSFVPIFMVSIGRAEDTARYTLGAAFGVALVCGIWFDKMSEFLNKNFKYMGVLIFVFILFYCYLTLVNRLSVLTSVKKFSPTFFEACDWVKKNLTEDSRLMTIWVYRAIYNCQRDGIGNQPDIALSKDVNLTLQAAKANGITHLFIQKFSIDPQNRHFLENYDLEFVEFLEAHPEHFVKVYQNGASLEQCKQYWQAGYSCDGNIIYEIKW